MGKKIWVPLMFFGVLSLLSACKTTSPFSAASSPWLSLPLAVPLQPTLQQEMKLARIDQLFFRPDLTKNDKAQLFYERGLVNDSLGLRDSAHFDFKRSLSLNPAQASIFNILGIYYTQSGMYDAAYEAFDSTLELNENHPLAARNRGIALYYGARYKQANRDLLQHYEENMNDPYRVLWLYFLEIQMQGKENAQKNLRERYDRSDKGDWGWHISKLYLNDISETDFFDILIKASKDNTQLAERLSEGYFYLAKRYQEKGDISSAVALYKLALSTNVHEYLEYRYSILELTRIAELEELAG